MSSFSPLLEFLKREQEPEEPPKKPPIVDYDNFFNNIPRALEMAGVPKAVEAVQNSPLTQFLSQVQDSGVGDVIGPGTGMIGPAKKWFGKMFDNVMKPSAFPIKDISGYNRDLVDKGIGQFGKEFGLENSSVKHVRGRDLYDDPPALGTYDLTTREIDILRDIGGQGSYEQAKILIPKGIRRAVTNRLPLTTAHELGHGMSKQALLRLYDKYPNLGKSTGKTDSIFPTADTLDLSSLGRLFGDLLEADMDALKKARNQLKDTPAERERNKAAAYGDALRRQLIKEAAGTPYRYGTTPLGDYFKPGRAVEQPDGTLMRVYSPLAMTLEEAAAVMISQAAVGNPIPPTWRTLTDLIRNLAERGEIR